ncbi:solute carrier family 41 member 1 [Anoplophora glabripennis]|uniref:solute carrier family 41 member 1 n=1 Tax=Anoplophora glabripennis TaxID=217634 RepID=UPI000874AB0B|nr:solute carrier family 41 member 1 [Anoplophora glabripennis]XP_018572012.1 solute carrier family 41 member 1 [Anoplophora glabripennis]
MVYGAASGIYTVYDPSKVESLPERKSIEQIQSSTIEKKHLEKEKWYSVTVQVAVPFFIAGLGTIGAGIVLGNVTEYKVFKEINALLILVPALLGLKGNLDMCLASRLSTQANLGNMHSKKEILKMIIGNIILVQIQAIVASCLVAVFAVGASALINGNFRWIHALLLATSSVLTATLSCFFLDIVLITLIIISHKIKLNPDNLATPMAASIGDVVSLIVLSTWAKLLFNIQDEYPWIMGVILGCYLCILLPIWILIVRKNHYTCKILSNGWTPVLTALVISGSGGLVLDSAVDQFKGYEVFQPIINGIGGNLVSVQASRISTMLHKTSMKGVIPPHTKQWVAPWTALFRGVLPAKTARILIAMSILGHLVFVFAADYMYNGIMAVTYVFVLTYIAVGLIQLMLLLYIAHIMIHLMWILKMDPDSSAIPYLTALGDLLGSSLLLLAFMFLRSIDFEYEPV